MRSVSISSFGDPTKVLELVERDMPEPGPGQVRIRMLLSPIHNHDLSTVAGVYGVKPALPAVPGTEAVGIVDALGEGVTKLAVGQRVMGGSTATWAEYYLGDAQRLVPVPDSIDDATACQLISMPLSAKMLLTDLDVKAGDWIIQNAANGAVGRLINQFAGEAGVNVINLVRREAGVEELKAAGIGNAVSTSNGNWRDLVAEITGGAPIVRGLDSVGGTGPEALLSVAAERSQIISFGNMTGEKITLSSSNLLFKQASLRGYWAARTNLAPEVIGKMIGELVTSAATGKLKLTTDATYELADAAEAARASLTPGRLGKITLKA